MPKASALDDAGFLEAEQKSEVELGVEDVGFLEAEQKPAVKLGVATA
jgi:hypothetical protein